MLLGSWYVGPVSTVPSVASECLQQLQVVHLIQPFRNQQTLQHVIPALQALKDHYPAYSTPTDLPFPFFFGLVLLFLRNNINTINTIAISSTKINTQTMLIPIMASFEKPESPLALAPSPEIW